MRNINIIAIMLFSLCSALSCTDKAEDGPNSIPLDINATIHSTRIAKQAFIPEDCIGIYLVRYNNGVPGILGDVNLTQEVNVEYAYDPSGYWYSKNGTDIFLYDEVADLYAYHPYDEGMSRDHSKTNLTAYPFAVDINQQEHGGEPSDFLWAKIPGLSTANFTAPIVFHHLMCRCEINIRLSEGMEQTETPVLWILNTVNACTINLRNGDVTPSGTTETIIPESNTVITSGYDFTYDAIMVPQSLSRGTTLFSIVLGGETYTYELQADLNMVSQTCYKFNLVAGATPTSSSGMIAIERITGNI